MADVKTPPIIDPETIAEEAPVGEVLVPVKARKRRGIPTLVWVAAGWAALVGIVALLARLLVAAQLV